MSSALRRIEDLIIRHFNASLTPEEETELADLLSESIEARRLLQRYMRLEGEQIELGVVGFFDDTMCEKAVDDSIETNAHDLDPAESKCRVGRWNMHTALLGWAAVAVAIAVTIAAPSINKWGSDTIADAHPSQAVAHFSRLVNVEWNSANDASLGGAIRPGTIALQEGLAEIEFENGATVIVEGPARLDVATNNRAFLHHGRLRSIVPPEAYGFTVESANLTVVDLGTEFGFEVDLDGVAEVHVFDGEIEMYEGPDRLSKQMLSAGQAVQFERNGWQREFPADEGAFVDAETLADRASTYVERLREEVKSLSVTQRVLLRERKRLEAELRNAPDLVQLRTRAETARMTADERVKSDRVVSTAIATHKKMQTKIDNAVRSKLRDTGHGKQLLEKLDKIDERLQFVKERITELRQDGGPRKTMRKLTSEARELQRRRTELRAKLRKEAGKLRKQDPDVRKAVTQFSKAKRRLDDTLQNSDVSQLKQNAESLRKAFLAAQNARLQDDPNLAAVRTKIQNLSQEIKWKRKRIHQARKLNAEDDLLEGEVFQSENDEEDVDSSDTNRADTELVET